MGWRSHDHDDRGMKVSKGIKEGAGLQIIDPEIQSINSINNTKYESYMGGILPFRPLSSP